MAKTENQTNYLLYFFLSLLLVFIMASRTPIDSDLWWHLRVGEDTVLQKQIILADNLSYTKFGEHWVNHSWLFRVMVYELFRSGGYLYLGGFVAILAALTFGIIYLQMSGPGFIRTAVIVIAAITTSAVWSPRPQLFSLLFLCLTGIIVDQYKTQRFKHLWIMLPLFILWSNLHGGFVIGLYYLGAVIVGYILNLLLGREHNVFLAKKQLLRLSIWTFLSAFAVMINPNGAAMWTIQFQTVDVSQNLISEWASPDFHDLLQQSYLWLFLGTFLLIGLSGRRPDITDIIPLIAFAFLGFWVRRNLGAAALVTAPIFTRQIDKFIKEISTEELVNNLLFKKVGAFVNRVNQKSFTPAISKMINLIIVASLTCVAGIKLYLVTWPPFVENRLSQIFPVGAVDWIKQKHPNGQIFNDYNWGGYLTYHLQDYPVYIDGRADLYGNEIMNEYMQIVQARGDWQRILDSWGVNLILLEPGWPINQYLRNADNQWNIFYEDDHSILYGRE
jgi:hypothetical protein